MSWITIAVFAILILFGVSGWSKGIIRTAVSLAAMVVTFIVCVWVTPSLCKNVKENTQVYDNLQRSIYNFIIEDENFNKAAGESLSDEEAVIISISQLEEYAGQIQKNVNDIMKKLNLPESVIGSGNGNGSYMQDVFHVTGNAPSDNEKYNGCGDCCKTGWTCIECNNLHSGVSGCVCNIKDCVCCYGGGWKTAVNISGKQTSWSCIWNY